MMNLNRNTPSSEPPSIRNMLYGVWELFETETDENLQRVVNSFVGDTMNATCRHDSGCSSTVAPLMEQNTKPTHDAKLGNSQFHNKSRMIFEDNETGIDGSGAMLSLHQISEGSMECVRALNFSANGPYRDKIPPLKTPLMFWTEYDLAIIQEFVRSFPQAYPYIQKLPLAESPELSNERFRELELEARNSLALMNHHLGHKSTNDATNSGGDSYSYLPGRFQDNMQFAETRLLGPLPPPPGFHAPVIGLPHAFVLERPPNPLTVPVPPTRFAGIGSGASLPVQMLMHLQNQLSSEYNHSFKSIGELPHSEHQSINPCVATQDHIGQYQLSSEINRSAENLERNYCDLQPPIGSTPTRESVIHIHHNFTPTASRFQTVGHENAPTLNTVVPTPLHQRSKSYQSSRYMRNPHSVKMPKSSVGVFEFRDGLLSTKADSVLSQREQSNLLILFLGFIVAIAAAGVYFILNYN